MRRTIVFVAIVGLILALSACASEDSIENRPTPTLVPAYTPVPDVVETDDEDETTELEIDVAEEVTADEVTDTTEEEGVTEEGTDETEEGIIEEGEVVEEGEEPALEELEIEKPAVVEAEETTEETEEIEPTTNQPPAEEADTDDFELDRPAVIEPTEDEETGEPIGTEETEETGEAEEIEETEETEPAATNQPPTAPEEAEGAETEADAFAGLPEEIAAFFPDEADPEQGAQLVVSNGCTACHSLEEGVRLVGPSWYGLGALAGERVEGQSAAEYLYRSIVAPNEHVVGDYPAGVMPQTYEDTLSDEQIAHMVAYLLSLQPEE